MTLFMDADGCPVVDEAVKIAGKYGVRCVILCDTAHVFNKPGAETITVCKGADSVDFALVNRLHPGDIVVTQDYGLAAMSLAKKAIPVSQDGMVYSDDNMDALLLARHTAKKIRQGGGRLRGPSKRKPEQDAAFEKTLEKLLRGGNQ